MAEYIDRERTVELLRSLGNREYRKEKGTIQDAIKMISYPEYTPAADVAPVVHGRWIPFHSEAAGDIQYCSACEIGFDAKTDYCPHCGAKMGIKDGGDNDGDSVD